MNKVPNKNKKGKRSAKGGRKSEKIRAPSPEMTVESLLRPDVMLNAYYTCHNAADFLRIRPVEGLKRKYLRSRTHSSSPHELPIYQ
ncbi:hypothetical protein ACHWQZ_G000541 [Mnemiopsis leidyi]